MDFQVKTFNQLSAEQVYQILRLRSEVFVVEQECAYQDIDDKDQKALHIFAENESKIIAYARAFDVGIYHEKASLGRFIIKETHRGKNLGHKLVEASLQAVYQNYGKQKIHISAQQHLTKFYEKHGFKTVGEGYLEDGIPHIGMEV
jgi:ElaA protein